MQRASATAAAVGLLLLAGAAQAADRSPPCRKSPRLAGRCFEVRGRLGPAPSGQGLRIWPDGDARQISVVDGEDSYDERGDLLPPSVAKVFSRQGYAAQVLGDFEVCPLTAARAGWVQHVCVAGASHVRSLDDEARKQEKAAAPKGRGDQP